MTKKIIYITVLAGLICFSGYLFAKSKIPFIMMQSEKETVDMPGFETWLQTKKNFGKINNSEDGEERCEKIWDVLWPWAKKGNLEARTALLFFILPPPDMKSILPPGNSGDRVSLQRDALIMFTHSLNYPNYKTEKEGKEYKKDLLFLYTQAGFGYDPLSQEFLKCVHEDKDNCTEIAVKNKLVPSFGQYAEQIDTFLEKGMKATCRNSE